MYSDSCQKSSHRNGAAQLYLGDQDRHDQILLDDSRRFASRIEAAGGVDQLHAWEGMTHVFASNLALQIARDALDDVGEYLQRAFHEANPL